MHEAARTIIMQTHAAGPALAGTKQVSYETWLVTMLVPMWVGVRVLSRSWALALGLGERHRRAGEPALRTGHARPVAADEKACQHVGVALT